jgi:hypothetical protein
MSALCRESPALNISSNRAQLVSSVLKGANFCRLAEWVEGFVLIRARKLNGAKRTKQGGERVPASKPVRT